MTRFNDERGIMHRHEDGREHRHFSAGFSIGGQVRPDATGAEEHGHFTLDFLAGGKSDPSGPVVWREGEPR